MKCICGFSHEVAYLPSCILASGAQRCARMLSFAVCRIFKILAFGVCNIWRLFFYFELVRLMGGGCLCQRRRRWPNPALKELPRESLELSDHQFSKSFPSLPNSEPPNPIIYPAHHDQEPDQIEVVSAPNQREIEPLCDKSDQIQLAFLGMFFLELKGLPNDPSPQIIYLARGFSSLR